MGELPEGRRVKTLSADPVLDLAVAVIESRGLKVVHPAENWETSREFADRLGVTPKHIWKRLHDHGCPPFEASRGPKNRINYILTNPALDEWCKPRQRRKL